MGLMEFKRCNGPLHNGELVPADQFWVSKSGRRKGRLYPRCRKCRAYARFGHTISGYVRITQVEFIFIEMENRVGRTEATKLMGTSANFYQRIENQVYVRKMTVRRAIEALRILRENNTVRHRDSINHGAKARGRTEKVVTERKHLYRPHGDDDAAMKRKQRLDSKT